MSRHSLTTADAPGSFLSTPQIEWRTETPGVGGFVDQMELRGFWRKRELHGSSRAQKGRRPGESSIDRENLRPKATSARVDDPPLLERGRMRITLSRMRI